MSAPSSVTEPPVTLRVGGNRPISASEVIDLPDPLSPTRPRISPGSMAKETPRTISGPWRTVTTRFSTLSIRPSSAYHFTESRVHPVAQRIAHEVQGKSRQNDHQARPEQQPRRTGDVDAGFGQHVPPRRNFG